MAVRTETDGKSVIAYISGEIDHHSAAAIRKVIDSEIEKNAANLLTLDFSDVTFMDSSGIGLVMGRYRLIKGYNGKVIVQNPPAAIKRVMRLSGIDKIATLKG
ncbi:MAG: STAS domain-containing protein [Ruminococcus sp.]|nr:STAS domain-containing protein [Ruminococcus sp.]